ncbi:hypothetical protein K3718_01300 [Leisingera aquaemixtae]|uniref:Uncharacterized protein n=1 Tax=Leisingera aquaemixtae TaxID=1396826 RepID=A0ABY5WJZ1_9RHOB|nr:hypothetical protein [Leisingera aquaemixtae]UWQ41754.1 hypothetical protein K3718_01300 [Leisingera aquaemixtae]
MTQTRVWFGQFAPTAFDKPGLRDKYPGQPWEKPYVYHMVPVYGGAIEGVTERYGAGILVPGHELVEASAVYDAKCFARQKHVVRTGGVYIVDEPLAELLSQFDVGPGGIFSYPIFEADETTLFSEKWFMLGLGAQKNTLRGDLSRNVTLLFDGQGERNNLYSVPYPPNDDDYVYSKGALEGADLWREPQLRHSFGFSNRLGCALIEEGYGELFGLKSARIAG